MKKYLTFTLSLLLAVLAVALGGPAAMAVPVGETGSDTDPNAGTPLENAVEDEPGKGIEQPGHAATGSAVEQAELAENKILDYVTKFKSHKYPMHSDFLRRARQVKVETKEPENYVIGEAILDCKTKSAYSAAGASYAESMNLDGILYGNDKKLFCECATIIVDDVDGYDASGNADGSPLMLFVTGPTDTHIVVEAINGPLDSGTMYVPDIPSGAMLHVMAPALSESEVEVAPDAAYPAPEKVYLQKKACAITYTEFFERINKKAAWNKQDVKDYQLETFRRKCTRSMLISAPSKRTKYNKRTGTEFVYTQKGILRQLRLGYQIEGPWTIGDIIGISKMLFGKYSTTDEMDVYMGPDAMENLANIDYSEHPEITVLQEKDEIQIGITKVKTPFGTLNFKLEYGLEDLGFSAYGVAFSMSDAVRFYYTKSKTITINHEKGEGGETREAKSQYYIQDDTLQLKGYNAMLIGPNVAAAGFSNIEATVTSLPYFPVSPSEGDIHYLTEFKANSGNSGTSFPGSPTDGQVFKLTEDIAAAGSDPAYEAGLYAYLSSAWTPVTGSDTVPSGLYDYAGSEWTAHKGVINA